VRLSDRLSWLYLALPLAMVHCATAEQEGAKPKQPNPPTGGSAPTATGGTTSSGGSPATGGFFSPTTGGRAAASSGGSAPSGGSKASGGVPATGGRGGSGGRASGGGGSAGSGGKTTNGGAGGFGGQAGGGGAGASASGGSAGSPFPATCSDGKRGGTETAIDCGGGTCPPCDTGDACATDSDCASTQCRELVCTPDHCGDGAPSGDESDEDCGGSCALCALGQICAQGSDCEGNNCSGGTCGEPAHCAYGWADDPCGESCLERTQSDQLACVEVLDCFVENDCGPSTCTSADAVCGNNKLQRGTAPYPYAAEVYACLCD
jgi:hypothetical protein